MNVTDNKPVMAECNCKHANPFPHQFQHETVGSATHGVDPGSNVHVLERVHRNPFPLKEIVLQAMRKKGESWRVLTVNEGEQNGTKAYLFFVSI